MPIAGTTPRVPVCRRMALGVVRQTPHPCWNEPRFRRPGGGFGRSAPPFNGGTPRAERRRG